MAERRDNDRGRQEHENKQRHESSRRGSSKGSERGSEPRTDSSDVKQREYRDKEGDVHHHTHEYMERHGNKGGSGSDRS